MNLFDLILDLDLKGFIYGKNEKKYAKLPIDYGKQYVVRCSDQNRK